MKWAFWRRGSTTPAAAARGGEDRDPGQADPARALRVRARRRLIGAAALLLAAVIVLPMVLDPAPRPVPEHVAIDIPAEKTPFHPRLPLTVAPPGEQAGAEGKPPFAPEQARVVEPAPAADGRDPAGQPATTAAQGERTQPSPAKDGRAAGAAPARPDERAAAPAADRGGDAARTADAQRARELLAGKSAALERGAAGHYFVQAAALRNEPAARELTARLKKAGLPSFTERVQASDGARWRVRVGPYASRQDAERARARLRELGTGADLIAP